MESDYWWLEFQRDRQTYIEEKDSWWSMLSAGCGWSEPFHWAGQEKILQSPKGTFYTRLVPDYDIGYFFINPYGYGITPTFPNCCGCNGWLKSPLVEKGKNKRGAYI